jgi:hypothetical protein
MLFTFLPLLLLTSVFALPSTPSQLSSRLQRRDLATVQGGLRRVASLIDDLTTKAKPFDGDVIQAVPVLETSALILNAIKDETKKISNTEALSFTETISILGTVYTLNNAVGDLVNVLIEKKPLFTKAFIAIVVADQLEMQTEAARLLVDAVVAKLPSYIPGVIGTFVASPILTKLERAVTAFTTNAAPSAPVSSSAAAKPQTSALPPRSTSLSKSPSLPKSTSTPRSTASS